MQTAKPTKPVIQPFPFWPVLGKSLLWSFVVAIVGGLFAGVLGVLDWSDQIPLLGQLAQSNKVVGVSTTLAVVVTLAACVAFFEEAGVFFGFFILSCCGLLVLGACIWFGHHAFNFFRAMIAGGLLIPTLGFPVTFWIVAKNTDR